MRAFDLLVTVGALFTGQPAPAPDGAAYRDEVVLSREDFSDRTDLICKRGPEAMRAVTFDTDGLRVHLPRGEPGDRSGGTGIVVRLNVKGNFEITTAFEVLDELAPPVGTTTRFTMNVDLERPRPTFATLSRQTTAKGLIQLLGRVEVSGEAGEKPLVKSKPITTKMKAGRLRMRREAATLSFLAADAGSNEFQMIDTFPFAADDVRGIHLVGATGSLGLDVRVTGLHVRADAIPNAPGRAAVVAETPPPVVERSGRRWILAGLLILVPILLAAAWIATRWSRRTDRS